MKRKAKPKSILSKDAALAEMNLFGRPATTIVELNRTVNRTLRIEIKYVSYDDFKVILETMAAEINRLHEQPMLQHTPSAPPQAIDIENACTQCGLHMAAINEIGCPKATLPLDARPGCIRPE
jgi:hypothetical protein